MFAVLIFIIILGILIFVHELGHFVVARRNGIRAHEFGFGFPPRIFGVQFMSGKQRKKIRELESVEVDVTDIKGQGTEVVKETITEKFQTVEKTMPLKKWRIIWGKHDGDSPQEEKDLKDAHRGHWRGSTIYSLNWIPIGGFVKIKGEDGGAKNDPDSFSSKSAWIRIKVLAAGVTMNFMLAWFLLAVALMVGVPSDFLELVDNNTKITISQVLPGTPAEQAGIKGGDEVLKNQEGVTFKGTSDLIQYINNRKGIETSLKIRRGSRILDFKVIPRLEVPENQGPLGIAFDASIRKFPWYEAIQKGFLAVVNVVILIATMLFDMVRGIFVGQKVAMDVAGPVRIAGMTKQAAEAGIVSLIVFTSFLSINLGIINFLPIPALDGGRILFVLIEKIKGSPVNQKVEQIMHTAFFFLLLFLMAAISIKEVAQLVMEKFG